MKSVGFIGMGALFLALGAIAPAYAQQGHEDDKGPKQDQPQQQKAPQQAQQQPKQQAQPQQRAQQQPQQQQQQKAPQQAAQQQPKQQAQPQERAQQQLQQQQRQPQQSAQQRQQGNRPSGQGQVVAKAQEPAMWQQHRATTWQSDHRSWQQRGGYDGYRIPQSNFQSYFGRNHGFVLYGYPMMIVGGFPSFQYNGFWFTVVDPWPEYWPANWYQTDDVYIDYSNDGYYMYDTRYPGVAIAINVSVD